MSSQFGLLKARRFAPFLRDAVSRGVQRQPVQERADRPADLSGGELDGDRARGADQPGGGIFILPFFLFSATAGQLADKYDKAKLARLVKLLEIVIMGVALLGFSTHSLEVLLTALFLLGLHSTCSVP
jgi:MFS family permease